MTRTLACHYDRLYPGYRIRIVVIDGAATADVLVERRGPDRRWRLTTGDIYATFDDAERAMRRAYHGRAA